MAATRTDTLLFMFFRRMRMPLIVLISAYAIATLGFTLMPGVDDQGQPWRMSLFEAFYVVSYTGSTIGFGEVPYAFTPAQRMWTIVSIYLTVIAWLFSVGSIIALLQDPVYMNALRRSRLAGGVRATSRPFYLVCGYGDTGRVLTHTLSARGYPVVVIDRQREKINTLAVEDLGASIRAFDMDARTPDNLVAAGLRNRWCAGVIAVTGDDQVNLKIAISAKLLNHKVVVHARADSARVRDNMRSFNTDHVVNPVEEYRRRFELAINAPDLFRLHHWLTSGPGAHLPDRPSLPRGRWIVCGYSNVGKAIYRVLGDNGMETVLIDADPDAGDRPPDTIRGRGTQAETLEQAGIERAAGVVAATGDDADNLSILITARALKPDLFLAALESGYSGRVLFRAAGPDFVGQPSMVVAGTILASISSNLAVPFIEEMVQQDNDFARALLAKLLRHREPKAPEFSATRISARRSPAIAHALEQGREIRLGKLLVNPRRRDQRLPLEVLMLRRDDKNILCPDDATCLKIGDRLLVAGWQQAATRIRTTLENEHALEYVLTGQDYQSGWVWRWFEQRFGSSEFGHDKPR
ncbi:MAG: NAD(P)-binding protein [Wenzhouxiangellaceae bacterium]|nr:NAD(P)-binding protein [Wenzhouxiangellaceae bacterium]